MTDPTRHPFPAQAFVRAMDHLLARNAWARERLAPFAGRRASVQLGALVFAFEIAAGGTLAAVAGEGDIDVRLELPAGALANLPQGPDALFREARVSGEAHFAETLGFVFRNLEWDVEEDLARLLGDPVAHRLFQGARAVAGWGRQAARNAVENLREYAVEEARLTPPREELAEFGCELDGLRDALARFEARLKRFEREA